MIAAFHREGIDSRSRTASGKTRMALSDYIVRTLGVALVTLTLDSGVNCG